MKFLKSQFFHLYLFVFLKTLFFKLKEKFHKLKKNTKHSLSTINCLKICTDNSICQNPDIRFYAITSFGKPKLPSAMSVPTILKMLQDECNARMLHSFTLQQQL